MFFDIPEAPADDAPTPAAGGGGSAGGAPDLTTEIIRAARRIQLPSAQIRTQPGDGTLVNLDTILYTDAGTFDSSVDLLGFAVDLRAEPTSFTWHHGDGTSQTTTGPGRPHPNQHVTHRYDRPHESVGLSVDITYSVSYRIDGGPWNTLTETLTATGPSHTIAVQQATPLLVGRN